LTSGSLLSIKDLVSLCDDIRGKSIPVIWGVKQPQYKRQMHENWAFHEVPHNWKPQVDLKEGLKEILLSIRSMKAGT
jgi:nucleoside-diphosphate-sugar epimerase